MLRFLLKKPHRTVGSAVSILSAIAAAIHASSSCPSDQTSCNFSFLSILLHIVPCDMHAIITLIFVLFFFYLLPASISISLPLRDLWGDIGITSSLPISSGGFLILSSHLNNELELTELKK
jgi:hypothetical protein